MEAQVMKAYTEAGLTIFPVSATEIRNFRVRDTSLKPGDTTEVSGELWINKFRIPGWWEPMEDKWPVRLLSDSVEIDQGLTGKGGKFLMAYRAPYAVGVYFLKAVFDGTVWIGGCESDRVPVRVEEKAPTPPPGPAPIDWISRHKKEILAAGLGGAGLAAVILRIRE